MARENAAEAQGDIPHENQAKKSMKPVYLVISEDTAALTKTQKFIREVDGKVSWVSDRASATIFEDFARAEKIRRALPQYSNIITFTLITRHKYS